LQFAINGQTEPAVIDDIVAAGYTVQFLSTEDVFEDASTGKINASGLVAWTSFEYQVVVSKDGESVPQRGHT